MVKNNATTTYFSEHPPMEPMKLALVENFPDTVLKLEKVRQLVKNCEIIKFFQNAVYENKLPDDLHPSSKSPVPAIPTIYSLADATNRATRYSQKKDKNADLSVSSNSPFSGSPRVDFRCSSEEKFTSRAGEEWMGGVRALRDSHVRLVQRQLRHIERLNRALDRVVKNSKKQVHL